MRTFLALVCLVVATGSYAIDNAPPSDSVPVTITNEVIRTVPIRPTQIIPPQIRPFDLRSESGKITTKSGFSKRKDFQFRETVQLQEVSFAPLSTDGGCVVRISINDQLAKVMKWQPPAALVGVRELPGGITEIREPPVAIFGIVSKWEPPVGIAGKWEPPAGIVLSPDDRLSIQVKSLGERGADGVCQTEVVALGVIPPDPI